MSVECCFFLRTIQIGGNYIRSSKKWLDAQSEQITIAKTFPAYLTLVDLKNDDYFELVLVEIPKSIKSDDKPKLKVYKGTKLISEQTLPGIPSSVKSLYVDDNEPRIPGISSAEIAIVAHRTQIIRIISNIFRGCLVIAVAIGPSVFFYKNLKPFFKYTFPSLSIDALEKEIWRKVRRSSFFFVNQVCSKEEYLLDSFKVETMIVLRVFPLATL